MTAAEQAANQAIADAVTTLRHAADLCERAGYGCLIRDSLADAQKEAQYALDTATERN